MPDTTLASPIAILGGTGPLGRGLAVRWARSGQPVVVGSRDGTRARALALEVAELAGPSSAPVDGAANAKAAAGAQVVCVAVPYGAQADLARALAPALHGRVLIATAVPMQFVDGSPVPVSVPAGSAAAELAQLCPGARVVAALHTVSARHLLGPAPALQEDVLVTGDDPEARALVVGLVGRIAGLRGLDAGPLVGAAATERLTPILLGLNRRHRAELGLRLSGLPEPHLAVAAAWTEAYRRAWRAGDWAAAAALFTPDCVYRSHPLRPLTDARAYTERAFTDATVIDCRFGRPIVAGPDVAVEYWAVVREAGTTSTLFGCDRLRLTPDGLCAMLRDTWAMADGHHEPQEGWGE